MFRVSLLLILSQTAKTGEHLTFRFMGRIAARFLLKTQFPWVCLTSVNFISVHSGRGSNTVQQFSTVVHFPFNSGLRDLTKQKRQESETNFRFGLLEIRLLWVSSVGLWNVMGIVAPLMPILARQRKYKLGFCRASQAASRQEMHVLTHSQSDNVLLAAEHRCFWALTGSDTRFSTTCEFWK